MRSATKCFRPGRRDRACGTIAALACLLAVPALQAGNVQRCEDAAGRVTYSNETCPPGTKRSRAVDTSQPVEADAKGAPVDRKDAPRIVRVQRTPTPAQAVAVNKDTLCRELATRVNYARRDLETASPQQRASAELAMRRAQEEYDLECKTE
ncbi:MAG: hypothetical protein OHK0044_06090 [Burkholderiaceae bacterium]